MSRPDRLLLFACLAFAIWLSDHWVWTLPAFLGVWTGVVLSKVQRPHDRERDHQPPQTDFGALLVIVSFVYLDVLLLVFEVGNETGPHVVALGVGVVLLPLVLLGSVAVVVFQLKIPRWLGRLWNELLKER